MNYGSLNHIEINKLEKSMTQELKYNSHRGAKAISNIYVIKPLNYKDMFGKNLVIYIFLCCDNYLHYTTFIFKCFLLYF